MVLIRNLFLISLWVIPIIFMMNTYLKMSKEEQEKFRVELKRPSVLFGLGIPVMGLLFFSTGLISTMKLLQHIGVIMVFISWFTTSVLSWKNRKTNLITNAGLILLGVIGLVAYSYLI